MRDDIFLGSVQSMTWNVLFILLSRPLSVAIADLVIVVDHVAVVIELDGALKAEHGLLVQLVQRCTGEPEVASPHSPLLQLLCLRPCKLLKPCLHIKIISAK